MWRRWLRLLPLAFQITCVKCILSSEAEPCPHPCVGAPLHPCGLVLGGGGWASQRVYTLQLRCFVFFLSEGLQVLFLSPWLSLSLFLTSSKCSWLCKAGMWSQCHHSGSFLEVIPGAENWHLMCRVRICTPAVFWNAKRERLLTSL